LAQAGLFFTRNSLALIVPARMKLILAVLALTVPAALCTSEKEFSALFGDKHDAGAVMSKLQGMMGAANQKLAVAQRHHKKVVKKVRQEADTFLQAEATSYGKYLNDFSAELTKSTQELQDAVDQAKAGIKVSESQPSSPNDWKDPNVEERAKLGAQVASAERTIKKAERRGVRSVREAEERAEETTEDEAQKLGMKVGDMTPLVDNAKKTLETVAEKAVPAVVAKVVAASKKVDLKGLEANVKKASAKQVAVTKEANTKLDGFLAATGKDVATKMTEIAADLEAQQKEEIAKVLGRTEAAPVKKAAAKSVKKVATVKASTAKVSPHLVAVPAKPTIKLPTPGPEHARLAAEATSVKAAAPAAKAPVKAAVTVAKK